MRARIRLFVLLGAAMLAACRASEDERRSVLESAARVDYALARGTVVRDLRSPSDSGRLIYDAPVHLSQRTAQAAGARQMWAPFGVGMPDTVASATVQ